MLQFLWVTAYSVQLRFFTMIPEVLYVVKNMFLSGGQPNTGHVELSSQALLALILSTPNVWKLKWTFPRAEFKSESVAR